MMKLILASIFVTCAAAFTHDPHHVKHNMLMYGESDVFASHLVYKVPHHYQVILKLTLDERTRAIYLRERRAFPSDQLRFLLDDMNIRDLAALPGISGTVLRVNAAGQKTVLIPSLRLHKSQYSIVYFAELPLPL